jgi:hypothetical protein
VPPLSRFLTSDSLPDFLDVALAFPRHTESAGVYATILRKYEERLREIDVTKLSDLMKTSDDTLTQLITDRRHRHRVLDALGVAKELYVSWSDVHPPAAIVSGALRLRIKSIEVCKGRLRIMQVHVTYTYVSRNHDTNGASPRRHSFAIKSTEGMRFVPSLLTHNPSITIDFDQDEYLTALDMTESTESKFITSLTFRTNKGRKIKCETESPKHMNKVFKRASGASSSSRPAAILGFKIGFKQFSTSSGITNIVCLSAPVQQATVTADDNDLPYSSETPYHHVEERVEITDLQRREAESAQQLQMRRRVNEQTGEMEGGIDDDVFSDLPPAGAPTVPPPAVPPPTAPPLEFQISEDLEMKEKEEEELKRETVLISPRSNIVSASYRAEFLVSSISLDTFQDPVILIDGHTYERSSIAKWFGDGNRSSPLTGALLNSSAVFPNHLVKRLLDDCEDKKKVKQLLTCSISGEMLVDPVVLLGDGETYERSALQNRLGGSFKGVISRGVMSPTTGLKVKPATVVTNFVVLSLLESSKQDAKGKGDDWDAMWASVRSLGR